MSSGADVELRTLLALTRRLPETRASRFVARALRKLYLRKPRPDVECDVEGVRMCLDPEDYVEGQLLFGPWLYEGPEREFVRSHLGMGDTFLDLGAHAGCYALTAARAVGPSGRVIAVEANPNTFERLVHNVRLSHVPQVETVQCGVSDEHSVMGLKLRDGKNSGAASFVVDVGEAVPVQCKPLAEILRDRRVKHVAGAKLDIEGLEYRVMRRFLDDADPSLWPGFVLVEQREPFIPESGGDVVALIRERGYELVWKSQRSRHWPNHILVRQK